MKTRSQSKPGRRREKTDRPGEEEALLRHAAVGNELGIKQRQLKRHRSVSTSWSSNALSQLRNIPKICPEIMSGGSLMSRESWGKKGPRSGRFDNLRTLTEAATSSHGRKPSHVWKNDELDYLLQCLGQPMWRGIYIADPKEFARQFKMLLNSTFNPSVQFTDEKVKEKMTYVYRKWFALQHPTEAQSSASTSKDRSAIQLIRKHMGNLNAIFGDNRSTSLSESERQEIMNALDYLHQNGCKEKELYQYREALNDSTLRRNFLDLFQVVGVGENIYKKRRNLFKLMVKEHKMKKEAVP